jgi:hypothetical protein
MSFGTGGGGGGTGCIADYYYDQWSVCYYQGQDASGSFLTTALYPHSPDPSPGRFWALNEDWGSGAIGGTAASDNVYGYWKGSFTFTDDYYLFSLFADDRVRLYIDDVVVLDRWTDGGVNTSAVTKHMTAGRHRIRVDWYESTGSAQMRLHWDRGPVSNPVPSTVVIDAFIVTQQDICIAGSAPGASDEKLTIWVNNPPSSNDNKTAHQSWKVDHGLSLPKVVKASEEAAVRAIYPVVECFSFGFRPEEVDYARDELEKFADNIENWSRGALVPDLQVTELSGEILLERSGGALWLSPTVLASAAHPYVSSETDFAFGFTSVHDLNTGYYYDIPACGFGMGADGGLWGSGYAWLPNSRNPGHWFGNCLDAPTITSEWGHQFRCAIRCVMQFDGGEAFNTDNPVGTWPACGAGPSNSFTYYPSHYDYHSDPKGPWCDWPVTVPPPAGSLPEHPGKEPQLAADLLWHFDADLSAYQLSFFTGNHCNDGRQDFGESGVDTGGNCP